MSAASPTRASLTRVGPRDDSDADQRPLDFRLIGRVLEYTRPYAVQRNWLFLCVLLRSVQLPGLTWVVAAVINGPVQAGDTVGVFWGAFAFLVLALFTQITMHYRQRLALELGESVVGDLRNAIFAHLMRMPLSDFQRTRVGRIISRMISDIEDVRVGVQEVLFVSLVQVGQMAVAATCMAWYDWQLFLIVLGLAPVLWIINRIFHDRLSHVLRAMRDSFSRVTATLAESVLGIRVTQGFVRQDTNAQLFSELVADHSKYNRQVMHTQGLFLPLLELNSQVFMAVLLLVGGWRVLQPESGVTLGELVGFFFMAGLFFAPVTVLGNQYNQALTAMAGAERIFKLLDQAPDWEDAPEAVVAPPLLGRVAFENVQFGYAPERPVLHDISFQVEPGQSVALVGQTGSGKTTIINLLAKFYLPQGGKVLLDGLDINGLTSESLHRQFGIVLQQNFLFHGSIAENIRFARPEATLDDVRDVCRRLDCLDLFEALPEGFETPVGERGSRLSLGQRQMVCFARALLADPRLLILDEATSSIDVATEQRLQRALAVLLAGRTSFIVAHRLSTIRRADLILVLEHGRIVERGNHDELCGRGGLYAHAYRRFASATQ